MFQLLMAIDVRQSLPSERFLQGANMLLTGPIQTLQSIAVHPYAVPCHAGVGDCPLHLQSFEMVKAPVLRGEWEL